MCLFIQGYVTWWVGKSQVFVTVAYIGITYIKRHQSHVAAFGTFLILEWRKWNKQLFIYMQKYGNVMLNWNYPTLIYRVQYFNLKIYRFIDIEDGIGGFVLLTKHAIKHLAHILHKAVKLYTTFYDTYPHLHHARVF